MSDERNPPEPGIPCAHLWFRRGWFGWRIQRGDNARRGDVCGFCGAVLEHDPPDPFPGLRKQAGRGLKEGDGDAT
jgi:hypothetical protein